MRHLLKLRVIRVLRHVLCMMIVSAWCVARRVVGMRMMLNMIEARDVSFKLRCVVVLRRVVRGGCQCMVRGA